LGRDSGSHIQTRIAGKKVLLAAAALIALALALQMRTRPEFAGQTYRIAAASFPPYLIAPADRTPRGFAVDTLEEAARRLGIRLEWVGVRTSAPQTLMDREADLYPMLALIGERKGKMAMSDPWWENGMVMIHRRGAPIRNKEDAVGKRIALIHLTFGIQQMERAFPGAVAVPEKDYDAVLWHTCNGTTDASLLDMRMAAVLALLPQCAGVELDQRWVPEMNITYGVGGRLGMEREVRALRDEIVRMAQDGTLTKLGEPWGVQVPNQNRLLGMMVASGARGQVLGWLAAAMGAAALALGLLGLRLRDARKRAERALALRSQFVANISHEIRTPMHGVLGMAELLEQTRLDESQQRYARTISATGRDLLRLLNDLLDFAKLESGKLALETIGYPPGEVAREAGNLFEAAAAAKGLSLDVAVGDSVPGWIKGDPARVRQILMNLLGNAVKFSENGRIQLRVEAGAKAERIRFSVKDEGIGLAPDQEKHIFEAFTQGNGSTSRTYGGSGLGLAICRHLVDLMGGEIGVRSRKNAGSEFWFEIPAVAAPPRKEPSAKRGAAAEASSGVEGLRVLVAEDNPVNQRVLTAHLTKMGCNWAVVSNGEEAVAMARKENFDVILMDGQMPGVDGFEATRRIRQFDGERGRVPVIGVTACAFEEDRLRCLDAGMNAVVTKPYTAADIRRELRALPARPD
jgi:signal transduction histidine kinase/ActR/RegA family two-component response regulator